MLRYIYLLCFVIVINFEFVFCYKYISGDRPGPARLRRGGRVCKRQASFEERPLQQIDVDSFILTPDEVEELQPEELYINERRFVAASGAPRGRRREAPYPATAPAGLSRYQRQQLRRRHLLHNQKKNTLTKIFPFFSHNKSDSAPKKGAKNKNCVGTCPKKAKEQNVPSTETVDLHKERKSQRDIMDELRVEKRFADKCLKCKNKFPKLKMRPKQPEVTHNSRQYFANHPLKDVETSSKFKNINFRNRFVADKVSEERRKGVVR